MPLPGAHGGTPVLCTLCSSFKDLQKNLQPTAVIIIVTIAAKAGRPLSPSRARTLTHTRSHTHAQFLHHLYCDA